MAHTLFFDGVCGLCDRAVQFVIARDVRDRFRFAALQSDFAKATLSARGLRAEDLDTMVVISGAGDLYTKARAALFVLSELGGAYRLSALLRLLPEALLDWGYDHVAKNRYRWFGRLGACAVPTAHQRDKFVDARP